jgi:hypothetical protein
LGDRYEKMLEFLLGKDPAIIVQVEPIEEN